MHDRVLNPHNQPLYTKNSCAKAYENGVFYGIVEEGPF
jgi:hypothetical protein